MVAMRMMQVAIDQIVDMITMRNRLVAAARTVHMVRVVAGAFVSAGTIFGIGRRDLHRVLIAVIAMRMMQVAVNQIIHMIAVLHRNMTAAGTVLMSIFVLVCVVLVFAHFKPLSIRLLQNLPVSTFTDATSRQKSKHPIP